MALELKDCTFFGHALPEPFARNDLEGHLLQAKLLPKPTGPEAKTLAEQWDAYRRKLRALGDQGGPVRVANHVLEPLVLRLGYATLRREEEVLTREGSEDGGYLLETDGGAARLRAWTVDTGADMDAPTQRGQAYRYSPSQIAQRVLFAKGERLGLLTDGNDLRLVFSDPAGGRGSHIAIRLDRGGWRGSRSVPDSYRLFLALAQPAGVAKVPDLLEQARLAQTRVTATLREQAKQAVQSFVQEVLDDTHNRDFFARHPDKQQLARGLYRDALVLVYRLLFILKLEASSEPERSFSFASTSLWRNTYSPSTALAPVVRKALDEGAETGEMLAGSLRSLFRLFQEGFHWSEVRINKLGGMLFGDDAAPLLDHEGLHWSERAAASLLDRLLWTPRGNRGERQRVHYGPLFVEDLGRVYEALLELEPGIATEPMCRLRRQKLEVVVPRAQGETYRANVENAGEASDEDDEGEEEEDTKPARGKTRVVFAGEIREGEFYLRVGLGRKATGSYYTPHAFVRFLIQETLGPQIAERSPADNPQPLEILKLKVLDPAMGSGHFLVEACRYLGEKLHDACRACDGKAKAAEARADKATGADKDALLAEASQWRKRVIDLPDPNDELLAYLPSRTKEGEETGLSDAKAKALCRRLVAVHCLYGVDKNPLAVELAKLALWLESYAEGLPLTFLDHRLITGDSLTGPFFEKLGTSPRDKSSGRIGDLYLHRLSPRLTATLAEALTHVRDLEASIGKDAADIELKRMAKEKLDKALHPFKVLAQAWSGGVMLGEQADDAAYEALMTAVAEQQDVGAMIAAQPALAKMVETGREGVAYDLTFPEVFYPEGKLGQKAGFHAVVGNPPWDSVRRNDDQFFAGFEFGVLSASTKAEKDSTIRALMNRPDVDWVYRAYIEALEAKDRIIDALFAVHKARVNGSLAGRGTYDDYMLFAERAARLARDSSGRIGMVFPSAFHSNEGAVGVRRLYIDQMSLIACISFENRRKLFEIHGSFKFALIVAKKGESSSQINCAFYMHDPELLFQDHKTLPYSRDFIVSTSGTHLSFLELRSGKDYEVANCCFRGSDLFGAVRRRTNVATSQELNMTYDSERFTPSGKRLATGVDPRMPSVASELRANGYLPLHEGKTFHQYTDRWGDRPRYLLALSELADKPSWLNAAQQFRLAFRDIANSTNERTGIFAILPPGVVCGNKAPCEKSPSQRPNSSALMLLAGSNAYPFDFILRRKARASINLFILDSCPVPRSAFDYPRSLFLAHSALRLSCNHEGYGPLWQEQLGGTWREPTPTHTWPVLAGDNARWAVRAAIDAVVADAYSLTRDQYAHVLSSFSHKSYSKAPELCLAAFDELQRIGLDAFVKAHDPYWDIPLVESLPKPVIELPGASGIAASATASDSTFKLQISASKGRKRTKGS